MPRRLWRHLGCPAAADSRGAHARGSAWRGPRFRSGVLQALGAKMGGGRFAGQSTDWETRGRKARVSSSLVEVQAWGTSRVPPLWSARLLGLQEMSPSPRPVDTPTLPTSSGLHFRCPVGLAVPTPGSFRRVLRRPWCRRAASASPSSRAPLSSPQSCSFPVQHWAWAACSPRGFLFCCYPKVKEPLRSWSHQRDSARRGMVRNGPSTFAVT